MVERKPIISARRTDALEALLQQLWTLRPELKEKQAFTIAMGVGALIREVERSDAICRALPLTASAPEEQTDDSESPAEEQETEIPEVHPDTHWG